MKNNPEKYVIFLSSSTLFQCELEKLRDENTTYIWIADKKLKKQLSKQNQKFFDKSHFLKEITFKTVDAIIKKYAKWKPKIVTIEEACTLIAADMRKKYYLDGPMPDDVLRFIDKFAMKSYLGKSDIRCPRYRLYDKAAYEKHGQAYLGIILEKMDFPLFVKPIDKSGARGCFKLTNIEEFKDWAKKTFLDEEVYEINEYVEGDLFHVDSLIKDNKVLYASIGKCSFPLHNFANGLPCGSIHLTKSHPLFDRIIAFNKKIIEELKPPNGATHLELFLTRNDELVFLEIGARPPGAIVPQIAKINFNIDYHLSHLQLCLGLETKIEEKIAKDQYAWLIFPNKTGVIKSTNKPNIESSYELNTFIKKGDKTKKSEDLSSTTKNYSGRIIFHNKNPSILSKEFSMLKTFEIPNMRYD